MVRRYGAGRPRTESQEPLADQTADRPRMCGRPPRWLTIYSAWPNAYPPLSRDRTGLPRCRRPRRVDSDGSAILDTQGRQVLLRGMNVTGLLQARDIGPGTPPGTDDFARMHAFGFEVAGWP